MERYGKEYAEKIVENVRTLAQVLHGRGWNIVAEHKGFIEIHQIAVVVRDKGGEVFGDEQLERANIILNKNMLSWMTTPIPLV